MLRDVHDSDDEAATGEGIETVLSWLKVRGFDGSLYSAVDLGNLAGRAVRTVAHPTLKIKRRDNRLMPVRTPGPDPHPDDDTAKLLAPHPGTKRLFLLGDGDSDPFATKAAMQRAQTRFTASGIDAPIDWAPAPHDFNSMLMHSLNL